MIYHCRLSLIPCLSPSLPFRNFVSTSFPLLLVRSRKGRGAWAPLVDYPSHQEALGAIGAIPDFLGQIAAIFQIRLPRFLAPILAWPWWWEWLVARFQAFAPPISPSGVHIKKVQDLLPPFLQGGWREETEMKQNLFRYGISFCIFLPSCLICYSFPLWMLIVDLFYVDSAPVVFSFHYEFCGWWCQYCSEWWDMCYQGLFCSMALLGTVVVNF